MNSKGAKGLFESWIKNATVFKKKMMDGSNNHYNYVLLPLESTTPAKLGYSIGCLMSECFDYKKTDMLFAPEAKGFAPAAYTQMYLLWEKDVKIPVNYIRKKEYNEIPGAISVKRDAHAYGQKSVFTVMPKNIVTTGIGDVKNGVFLDDVASSGKTTVSIVNELNRQGYNIEEVGMLLERSDGVDYIKDNLKDVKVNCVCRIEVDEKEMKAHVEEWFV